jgi:putative glutamine amidotransferase
MPTMPTAPRPLVLVTTSTSVRSEGLRRHDTLTGRNYSQALLAEGALPVMVASLDPASADDFVARVDGLLLSGGVDVDPARYGQAPHQRLGVVDPERDAFEFALYRAARARGLPVLGVCRGHQVINVAEGGTLHQHLPDVPGTIQHQQQDLEGRPLHRVRLAPRSRAAAAAGTTDIVTNSHHHQGIDRLGATLVAAGHADDGLVEVVEGREGAWLLGLQGHPEMVYASHPEARWPFRAFVAALRAEAVVPSATPAALTGGGGA